MAASTTSTTTSTAATWDSDDWEIVNDDGFVYKRKKRRIDPTSFVRAPDLEPDPAILNKERRKRRRKSLLKLKEKYKREIGLWDKLSNSLKAMEDSVKSKNQEVMEKDGDSGGERLQSVVSLEKSSGSLLDELLLQVEAQEAIIHKFENFCDVADSFCNAQEEKAKQHFFDLPIWDSPRELMASLCED